MRYTARPGIWTQLHTTVTNPDDTDRVVSVLFETEDRSSGKMIFRRTHLLPARSQGLVQFAARPLELGRRDGGQPIRQIASVLDGPSRTQLARLGDVMLAPVPKRLKLLAVLDDRPARDLSYGFLATASGGGTATLVTAPISHLGDQWYALAGVDALALGTLDLDRRRAGQVRAICDWVSRGGVLILFASDGSVETLSGELGDAAGVAVAGAHRVRSLNVRSADGEYQWPVTLDKSADLLNLAVPSAEVLFSADGAPILTRAPYGMGYVFVLALPLNALAQPPLGKMFKTVRRAMAATPAFGLGDFADDSLARLQAVRVGGG